MNDSTSKTQGLEGALRLPSGRMVFFDVLVEDGEETFTYAGATQRVIEYSVGAFESAIDAALEMALIVQTRMAANAALAHVSNELAFGLTFKGSAGIKVVSIDAECSMQMTLRWDK